ncbi:MAG: CopG family transcriptional regulator [Deltaproteobacteria bacterium]|nr:MAG: CopG family transcriptional regulator [Deltaproteobacteria bacterium]
MRTIQMTLDDTLIESIDNISRKLNMNRSDFTRKALRDAVEQYTISQMEKKHQQGYKNFPTEEDEFSIWEDEQVWGKNETW